MKKFLPLAGVLALAVAGCGAGGDKATPSVASVPTTGYPTTQPPGTTTSPSAQATAKFVISIPLKSAAASSTSRHPDYVSPNTKSLSVALTSVNGTAYSTIAPEDINAQAGYSSGANSCNSSATSLTCTVAFDSLPLGTDGFTVNTYSAANEGGSVLSTNTTTATVSAATITSVPLALQGNIATVAVVVGSPSLVPSTASTHAVTVTAYDASGAQIVGSANYNNGPLVMTTDDTYSAISGLTNLASPAGSETFSYNGTLIPATEHIIATAGTITGEGLIPVQGATMTLSTVSGVLPVDASFSGTTPTYAETSGTDSVLELQATQANWGSAVSHPFTVSANTCGTHVVVTTGPGTDQFTLTSGGTTATTCAVTIAGGGGSSNVVNVTQAAGSNGVSVGISANKSTH